MLVLRRRLAIAGVITAVAIAPDGRIGVRIRFTVGQARVTAGVCRQRQQVCGGVVPDRADDRPWSRREPGPAGRRLGCSRAARGLVSGASRRECRA